MRKKLLVKLIQDLEQEMLRLGYTNSTIKFYRGRWKLLIQFANERGEKYFSEHLGLAFLEKYFIFSKKISNFLFPNRKHKSFALFDQ